VSVGGRGGAGDGAQRCGGEVERGLTVRERAHDTRAPSDLAQDALEWVVGANPPPRPVGRPPNEVRRFHANFSYEAATWTRPRRGIAQIEWHPSEPDPRVGLKGTNMSRPAERVVAFYNKRGTCEQWIKEGKGAIKWTRLSCRTFAANAVRLQLHALAYNLANFLRTLATPEPMSDWSLTTL